ncbi:APC family permease [Cellulosilyticum sp. I15G10I2]|uniref:APC family permease n=1 Tax=Cellulosilyticum sp. I15G10I2 TaxID=1892843 RepID=UPI00085BF6FB|nr:APC family permease [Cellulosilyticum sp. I15G10I2]
MTKNKYGLFTCIAMIVGVVIGSGIFFKSDNILVATGGSIVLGVLVFCIAAISIIFGSLTIAELAARNDKAGGIITYAEDCYNPSVACAFGWFHTFLYYPTLTAVISWVAGIYICILFNIEGTLEMQTLIGLGVLGVLYITNLVSSRLGGYFQNASTIIKLIPLILIGILGLVFGNPSSLSQGDVSNMSSTGWIAAIIPIIFAFDGWIVATSISHEVKDAKKNIPLALIFSPLLILVIYILYFVGISVLIGTDNLMSMGDAHVDLAANQLFGSFGAKLILVFVVISVMGTVNGLIMGLTRMPYALAIRNMFPYSSKVSTVNKQLGIPVVSSLVTLAIVLFWFIVHYVTQKNNLLPNSDISEISITLNYVGYVILYIQVFRYGLSGEIKGFWRSKANPVFATLGSLIILIVGMRSSLFWLYALLCGLVVLAAFAFWKRTNK